MIRRLVKLACALALLLSLGCGNKGPLYLPTPEGGADTGARAETAK